MFKVIATQPHAGPRAGTVSSDSREIGPFESRSRAEDAAARLVDDPRRYARITIEVVEVDESNEA